VAAVAHDLALDSHAAVRDKALETGPADVWELRCQQAVQPPGRGGLQCQA
jgi:hypothetical protein